MAQRITPEQEVAQRREAERLARIYLRNNPPSSFAMQSTPESSLADQLLSLFQKTSLKDAPMTLRLAKRRGPNSARFTFNPNFKLTSLMDTPTPVAFSPTYAGVLAQPVRRFRTVENADDFQYWLTNAMREVNEIIAKGMPSSLIGTDDPGYHCTLYGMPRPLTEDELQALCELYTKAGWPRVVASNASVAPNAWFVCFQLYMAL